MGTAAGFKVNTCSEEEEISFNLRLSCDPK